MDYHVFQRGDNEVLCVRLPCPDLPCPTDEAVRKHPQDCCMTCPGNWIVSFVV